MKRLYFREIFVLFYILLFLASCYAKKDIIIQSDTQLSADTKASKIPLKAGLYISDAIKSQEIILIVPSLGIHLGNAFVANSEMILKNIFQEVTIINAFETFSEGTSKKYDVIISPQIILIQPALNNGYLQITTKWIVSGIDGKEIYTTIIKGSEFEYGPSWHPEKNREDTFFLALHENFKKAQDDIYLSNWWKHIK